MAIPDPVRMNFDTLLRAAGDGNLALMECVDAATRGGITVVVEPKPHWAEDMCAFRLDAREYCRYADWIAHGGRARFYGHIDTSGDDVMMKARAMIAREIADGFWE